MSPVKRQYDATARRARAQKTYDHVVSTAGELFLARGFSATTVSEVVSSCGLSAEYVYKRFGSKAGLVRAVVARALEGEGPVSAETRSDALESADPMTLVEGWGRLVAEVAPRVAPVLLLLRAAAAQDPNLATLADDLDESRRVRMAHNALRLADGGHLRAGTDIEEATDVLWSLSSPELYDLLVVRSGWSPADYGDFVARGIAGELLGP